VTRATADPLYLATAVEAARNAARIHRQYFRRDPLIQKKGRIDLVTAADLEVEQMFRTLIAERFPSHGVVGEEAAEKVPSGPGNMRYRWFIDPLDGTTNFAHGIAFFCVSIALEIGGRVEVGVVYDPMAEELFTAERGKGARLNETPLRVTSTDALVDALLATGSHYSAHDRGREQVAIYRELLGHARAIRRLGSAALNLSYVAAGRFDGYWETRIHPWDVAAGALIVEEAGGQMSGTGGEQYDPFSGHLLASNGRIHGLMLDVIEDARGKL
jgi:myo-inositol-1(or 4)-monophosphatase